MMRSSIAYEILSKITDASRLRRLATFFLLSLALYMVCYFSVMSYKAVSADICSDKPTVVDDCGWFSCWL